MWANTTNAKSGIWPKSDYAAKTSSVTEDNFSHLAYNSQNRIFTVLWQWAKRQKQPITSQTSSVTEDAFSHLPDNSQNRIFVVLWQMTKGQKQPITSQTSSVTEDVFSRICGFIKRRVY